MTRRTVRSGLALMFTLLLAAPLAGCDEATTDTRPDSERIVGTWTAASASVIVRSVPIPIRVADLTSAGDEQSFTFAQDGRFAFVFDPQDGRTISVTALGQTVSVPVSQTVRLAGTYTLDTGTQTITFSTVPGQTVDDFQLGYGFSGSRLDLKANDFATLVRLFGFAGTGADQLAQIVTGGQLSYTGS